MTLTPKDWTDSNRRFETFRDELLNMPPVIPSLLDKITALHEQREEMLLAVMAAGVPASDIELVDTTNRYDFREPLTMSLGFRFKTNIWRAESE